MLTVVRQELLHWASHTSQPLSITRTPGVFDFYRRQAPLLKAWRAIPCVRGIPTHQVMSQPARDANPTPSRLVAGHTPSRRSAHGSGASGSGVVECQAAIKQATPAAMPLPHRCVQCSGGRRLQRVKEILLLTRTQHTTVAAMAKAGAGSGQREVQVGRFDKPLCTTILTLTPHAPHALEHSGWVGASSKPFPSSCVQNGEKPTWCSSCSKEFSSRASLRRHAQTACIAASATRAPRAPKPRLVTPAPPLPEIASKKAGW